MNRVDFVGEFVIITKKNDEFFGRIGIVSNQDCDNWQVIFPGYKCSDNFYKKSNFKVITKNVIMNVIPRGGKSVVEFNKKDILVNRIANSLINETEEQLAEKIFEGTFEGIFSCEDCPAVMLCTKMLPGAFDEPNGLTCKDVLIKFMKED